MAKSRIYLFTTSRWSGSPAVLSIRRQGRGIFAISPARHRRRRIAVSRWTLPWPVIGVSESSDLLLHIDAKGLHLAVEVAAFEAKPFSGAAHVAVKLVQLLQDEVALICFSRFDKARELLALRTDPS